MSLLPMYSWRLYFVTEQSVRDFSYLVLMIGQSTDCLVFFIFLINKLKRTLKLYTFLTHTNPVLSIHFFTDVGSEIPMKH